MKSGAGLIIFSLLVVGMSCIFSVHISHFQQTCAGAVPDLNCPKGSPIALFSAHLASFHTFSSSDASPFLAALLLSALISLIGFLVFLDGAAPTPGFRPVFVREPRFARFSAADPFLAWLLLARYPSDTF